MTSNFSIVYPAIKILSTRILMEDNIASCESASAAYIEAHSMSNYLFHLVNYDENFLKRACDSPPALVNMDLHARQIAYPIF